MLSVLGTHQDDLWQCVEQAGCSLDDEDLQLVVFRDPRAVTVSSYFHILKTHEDVAPRIPTIDEYFQKRLAAMCMWTTVRHVLFTTLLADRSEVFFFDELLADPVDWYARLFSFVGLELPSEVVSDVWRRGSHRGSSINVHPGGHNESNRTFASELGAESLEMMDDVLRVWLPTVLLQRFGIPG